MADFYRQFHSNEHLVTIWKSRYVARVQNISTNSVDFRKYPLEFAASETGRKKTLNKLSEKLIKEASHTAAAKTRRLYLQHEYLKFSNTVDLSKFTLQTIPVLLHYYKQQPPVIHAVSKNAAEGASGVQFGIANVVTIAGQLETCFSKFYAQYSTSKDWLIQCFLTTQISLTSASLLAVLDPVEQAMLKPYCDLLEEYVSIPWARICLAAGQQNQSSPNYQLVKRMLANAADISWATHRRWANQFSEYVGPRGSLNELKVRRSSLRDFDMFQAYLWLCLLQGSLEAIEKELVVFCAYVFAGLGIPWQMTITGTRLLLDEILGRLTSDEKVIAQRYIDGLMQAISSAEKIKLF